MNDAPWGQATTRNLCDRLYDKRKLGAIDVETIIRDLNKENEREKILQIVDYIVDNLSTSSNGNYRKGGLIAFAAVAIGLGPDAHKVLGKLVSPVCKCFNDQDHRVRYYACESMYNITKAVRSKILPYFNEIFDGLCKLSADPDVHVKNGAQLLDRLVKEIITEEEKFDISSFITLLKERIYVANSFVREFLLGWITALDAVPHIKLRDYLPDFLDAIFAMLSDKNKQIRTAATDILIDFLQQIINNPLSVQYGEIILILIPHSTSTDEITRKRALIWIDELIKCGNETILSYSNQLLVAILPSLSHDDQSIKEIAIKANMRLLRLVESTQNDVEFPNFDPLLNSVLLQLKSDYVNTKLAALKWVTILHEKSEKGLHNKVEQLFPLMLKLLSDNSEQVVTTSLEVLSSISHSELHFFQLINSLVELFNSDPFLLEKRGSLILRQLSSYIPPVKIYKSLASILETTKGNFDLNFASIMIQTLNIILFTSIEFSEIRTRLKDLSIEENRELFINLYRSWCHNPISTFSLCLMAYEYQHAYFLVRSFSKLDISVNFLLEIDKLVYLLESPIFTPMKIITKNQTKDLRLQLLEPSKYPYLYKCLYGLLMLLPQSDAFDILKNRLNTVTSLGSLYLIPKSERVEPEERSIINFDELFKHFEEVQSAHSRFNRAIQRANELALSSDSTL